MIVIFHNFCTPKIPFFQVCISQSAVHTKFQTHSERGKKITADLKDIMERTYNECLQAW